MWACFKKILESLQFCMQVPTLYRLYIDFVLKDMYVCKYVVYRGQQCKLCKQISQHIFGFWLPECITSSRSGAPIFQQIAVFITLSQFQLLFYFYSPRPYSNQRALNHSRNVVVFVYLWASTHTLSKVSFWKVSFMKV